ncbi:MAG: hypothetical protein ACREHD_18295, partial [Pirellulales bacterium]
MRRPTCLAAAATAALCFCLSSKGIWPSAANEPTKAAPATAVAVIDLARIFNSHELFKKLSDALRSEVEAAEQDLKKRKAAL